MVLFLLGITTLLVVPQPETTNAAENQPIEDPPSSRFTWKIENFSRLNTKKHYSDTFIVGGYKWYVLAFLVFQFLWCKQTLASNNFV